MRSVLSDSVGRAAACRLGLALGIAGIAVATSGCGVFGGGGGKASVSVFDIKPGECFNPPGTIKAELSTLSTVGCNQPHTEESYAQVAYTNADGSQASAYPGDALLKTFADGACAQRYTGYVGRDYLDSAYFFTYLLPSARGWEQRKDRNVVCFVTTTGQPLTASVKGSQR